MVLSLMASPKQTPTSIVALTTGGLPWIGAPECLSA